MPEFVPVIFLSTLNGSNGFRIEGASAYDYSGVSVASAGDINGDGLDDIIIGAHRANTAHVLFGKTSSFGARFELSALNAADGFRIIGETQGAGTGYSVASAGDVNGDGIDDLIVGAPSASPSNQGSGASYVVFGKEGNFGANLSLSTLDGHNGFRIAGIGAGDRSGRSVASGGDVNGDGFDDLIVGAPSYGDPTGAAFVVFGQADDFDASVNLSTLNGFNGFRILGQQTYDEAGYSVASIGDLNGDGFDDIVIGAPRADPNGDRSGASYVVFGRAGGMPADFDLSTLNGTNGFKMFGTLGDYHGNSVASAGDINGDGFEDLVVAGYNTHIGGFDSGAAFIVFGKPGGFPANISILDLDGEIGFRVAANASREIGTSVASAGDVNGDGFDDLIIGAHHVYGSGGAFVLFGAAGRFPSHVDITSLDDGVLGFHIRDANNGYDLTGHSIASAGDINGDGFDDLIVGAPGFGLDDPDPNGQSYVIYGHRALEAVGRIGTNIGQTINGGLGIDHISGLGGDDVLKGWESADTMWGGSGDDIYVLNDAQSPDGFPLPFPLVRQYDTAIEFAGDGIDTVRVRALDVQVPGPDGYVLGDNIEFGVITGGRAFSLSGNALDNRLVGNRAANTLRGFEGDDVLNGLARSDVLIGGTGDDIYLLTDISQPGGSLTYDIIGELRGEGHDEVRVTALNVNAAGADSYSLTSFVDDGTILGTLNFGLTGNDLANRLTGNAANNRLIGLNGNDTLTGGLGRDVMGGGNGSDRFDFNIVAETGLTAATRDLIAGFTHLSDRIDLATIDAIGGGANNTFVFRGSAAFSEAGQLRVLQSGSDTIVELNTGGTLAADAAIQLSGVTAGTLSAIDFLL